MIAEVHGQVMYIAKSLESSFSYLTWDSTVSSWDKRIPLLHPTDQFFLEAVFKGVYNLICQENKSLHGDFVCPSIQDWLRPDKTWYSEGSLNRTINLYVNNINEQYYDVGVIAEMLYMKYYEFLEDATVPDCKFLDRPIKAIPKETLDYLSSKSKKTVEYCTGEGAISSRDFRECFQSYIIEYLSLKQQEKPIKIDPFVEGIIHHYPGKYMQAFWTYVKQDQASIIS
jgi:hypothetical protein